MKILSYTDLMSCAARKAKVVSSFAYMDITSCMNTDKHVIVRSARGRLGKNVSYGKIKTLPVTSGGLAYMKWLFNELKTSQAILDLNIVRFELHVDDFKEDWAEEEYTFTSLIIKINHRGNYELFKDTLNKICNEMNAIVHLDYAH